MRKKYSECRVDDCDGVGKLKGLCIKHYWRWKRWGDPLKSPGRWPNGKRQGCDVEGCGREHASRGFCMNHYNALRRGKDPHTFIVRENRGSSQYKREVLLRDDHAIVVLSDGQEALIDKEDVDLVRDYNWYPLKAKKGFVYAGTNMRQDDGSWKSVYLHRWIMSQYQEVKKNQDTDHISGMTLDCRKVNLRIVSRQINVLNNHGLNKRNTSGYTGVGKYKDCKQKWYGRIVATFKKGRTKTVWGKMFDNPEEAAAARDLELLRIYGSDIVPRSLAFPERFERYQEAVSGSLSKCT